MIMLTLYHENTAKWEKKKNLAEAERKLKEEKLYKLMKLAPSILSSIVEIEEDILPEASSSNQQ